MAKQKFTIAANGVDPNRVPKKTLCTGEHIPAIGFGTFGSDRFTAEQVAEAVRGAISVGYRHIDCASVYGNEHLIGNVLKGRYMYMKKLVTTLGAKNIEEMGFILSHEHVFVDLRTWDTPGYAQADVADVVRVVAPELAKARESGITAIVECSTGGVGRRADIIKAVSEAVSFPILVPTGVYREPWIPRWIHDAEEQELKEWMEGELNGDIEGSGVRAAWIKLSAGDEGLTECEKKVLRAAAKAGVATNAVIGSHTIKGRVVKEQLDIIEKAGYEANRFIWIHAQAETDFEIHLEVARRGAWIGYDGICRGYDELYINLIRRMLDAGYGKQILLSQDRVGYMPGQPGGNNPQSYTYICDEFLPKLHLAGVDKNTINEIMTVNPFNAFAR